MSKLVRKVDTSIHISPKLSFVQFNAPTLCYVHFEYVLKRFKRFYTGDMHARRDNNSVGKTDTQEPRKLVALTRKKEIRRRIFPRAYPTETSREPPTREVLIRLPVSRLLFPLTVVGCHVFSVTSRRFNYRPQFEH